jgi:outer membrane protein
MKYILVLLTAFSFFMSDANAQKFGHINTSLLMDTLPETKTAMLEIETLTAEIQGQISAKEQTLVALQQEIQTMQQDQSIGQFTLQTKINEFQNLQQDLENLVQTGEATLAARQSELIQPINIMAKDAIDKVGEENGYTYIFDVAYGSVIYESGDDVMTLVLDKINMMRASSAE